MIQFLYLELLRCSVTEFGVNKNSSAAKQQWEVH